LRVPTRDDWMQTPSQVRPGQLLCCSSFYALIFLALYRSARQQSQQPASRTSHTLAYAVHLLRVAVAYQLYDQPQSSGRRRTAATTTEADNKHESRNESVDVCSLQDWYPASMCKDTFGCMSHVIATIRNSSAGNTVVVVEQSIFTLLVKLYQVHARTAYDVATASRVRRNLQFPTGVDVIGSLLDTVCRSSRLLLATLDTVQSSSKSALLVSTTLSREQQKVDQAVAVASKSDTVVLKEDTAKQKQRLAEQSVQTGAGQSHAQELAKVANSKAEVQLPQPSRKLTNVRIRRHEPSKGSRPEL
jgi:hypothetical protein